MNTDRIRFVGAWSEAERKLAGMSAAATEEFLGVEMPRRWVFVRGSAGFSVTQPALFQGEASAAKLPDLLEQIRSAAAALDRARPADDLLRCPVCGREKRLDRSKARPLDVQHCGRVMRLVEGPMGEAGQGA